MSTAFTLRIGFFPIIVVFSQVGIVYRLLLFPQKLFYECECIPIMIIVIISSVDIICMSVLINALKLLETLHDDNTISIIHNLFPNAKVAEHDVKHILGVDTPCDISKLLHLNNGLI